MCAIGVTSESKTLEPFYDIVCCCLDARDFLAPSYGDNGNSGNKKRRKKKEGERKGKRQGEKRRKSLARASSLKWFGERWHAKLESSVSPSPLWLHIKRNREKFFPTQINGAGCAPWSLNNTDYLVYAFSEFVRISSCLIKVFFFPLAFFQMQVHRTFQLFRSNFSKSWMGGGRRSGRPFLSSHLSANQKQILGRKHLTEKKKTYRKHLLHTKGKISERINS